MLPDSSHTPLRTPPLALACPTCRAPAGSPCIEWSATGKRRVPLPDLYHRGRRMAALRASAALDARGTPPSAPSRQQLAASFLARLERLGAPSSAPRSPGSPFHPQQCACVELPGGVVLACHAHSGQARSPIAEVA